jgi:hypothetical protein
VDAGFLQGNLAVLRRDCLMSRLDFPYPLVPVLEYSINALRTAVVVARPPGPAFETNSGVDPLRCG